MSLSQDITNLVTATNNLTTAANNVISTAVIKENLLSEIQAVDGSGSGLDADKLDGFDATQTPTPNVIPVADGNGFLNLWIDLNNIIFKDRATGIDYRVFVENGSLKLEAV